MNRLFYILIVIACVSCSKEQLGPQCESCNEEIVLSESTDVLIMNEGNFGWGNGSLSLYQPSSNSITNNVFTQANSIPLGDVVQSAFEYGNNLYIVVNNSGKIEVVNKTSFTAVATISGFNSPRYFLPINSTKAYVTDLYANAIQIVDLSTNSITGSISTGGWTEKLLMYNDTVYACDMTNDNLLIIDPATNSIIDSIKVGVQPNSLVKDKNNKMWVLCSGGISQDNPKLIKFNPQLRTIESTFIFSSISDSPSNLCINKDGSELYYTNSNIYQMNVNATSLPSGFFIANNNNTFYGLGIHPDSDEIYVADAVDYVQSGVIFRYSASGTLLHQFNSGIIPGNFLFLD